MNRVILARLLATTIVVALAACSITPKVSKTPQPVSAVPLDAAPDPAADPLPLDLIVAGQLEDLMQYYDAVRRLPPGELARVHEKVRQNFTLNRSDMNRARLIVLLILPNTASRDPVAALQLLNDWQRGNGPVTGLQSFRNLLLALLAEQQKLGGSVEELSLKLKEEQKRAEILQKQIEAIKSMERNLILRAP